MDAALRPEGKAGQLVRTLSSHRIYYEKWAKTWEFQAMLKARPAAGDLQLGQAFVDLVTPMVWRAAERENFVADTQAMRKRVVAHIPARDQGRELKLGEGGLRDVEFSVQLLQLVHGRVERLRSRATLPALRSLIDNGYVGREDGKVGAGLSVPANTRASIQLFNLRRTHLLPNNDHDLRRLGRSLGYKEPVKELLSTWRHTSQRVRRLHERLFYSPLLDAVAKIPSTELRLTTDAALDRLRALGYADPTAALRHIAALSQGVTRQAEIQRQLLPAMLGWFAQAPILIMVCWRSARCRRRWALPLVPAGAPRRGRDGRAAGPHFRLQPVRGRAAEGLRRRCRCSQTIKNCGPGHWPS